jgi:hypothetical protein
MCKKTIASIFFVFLCISSYSQTDSITKGFFDFKWKEDEGKIKLIIPADKLNFEFLYVNSLASGVGSNDIGLDRGQLGNSRIVKFERHGDKIFLVQNNLRYRAISDNPLEKMAVEEAFAKSILWGFKLESKTEDAYIIDLTPMLLSDMHKVGQKLNDQKQGTYKLDPKRSAIYMDRTKNFPKNTEFESTLTFGGTAKGSNIMSVTPTADAVTVRQHHSFIELPDDNYQAREFHPYSGFISINYYDYASPIEENMKKILITRHRLQKKVPGSGISEPIEPIIYYIDAGCPEPVKSALIGGGRWWSQAFEAAGFKNAFMIKELPKGADPLDIRYNMIQWVHRSTRGWSYGASVTDPRTGEIIKGHVSLGSLRVKQDYMIAQALLSPFENNDTNTGPMKEMALARLRQLSAHEIGHTIGLTHNFAASVNNRASVMDYPHPYIGLKNGTLDFSEAYDDKIGDWDKRAIIYGYSEFDKNNSEKDELLKIINKTISDGYHFISDSDARPQGGSHSLAHLWDNGKNATEELNRVMEIRRLALQKFGENTIQNGTPYSELEKILVPLYLFHRYQIEATSKLIGGVNYSYATKGDAHKVIQQAVSKEDQQAAIDALLNTLSAENLSISPNILRKIPPPAYGHRRERESFNNYSGISFGSTAAIESLVNHTLSLMLQPQRLSGLNEPIVSQMKLSNYLKYLSDEIFKNDLSPSVIEIRNIVQKTYFIRLLELAKNQNIDKAVSAEALFNLYEIKDKYLNNKNAQNIYLSHLFNRFVSGDMKITLPGLTPMPPGSPIGCFN